MTQIEDGSRERLGRLLRKVVPGVRDLTVDARTGEVRRGCGAVGRGEVTVGLAVEGDGGHGDGR